MVIQVIILLIPFESLDYYASRVEVKKGYTRVMDYRKLKLLYDQELEGRHTLFNLAMRF